MRRGLDEDVSVGLYTNHAGARFSLNACWLKPVQIYYLGFLSQAMQMRPFSARPTMHPPSMLSAPPNTVRVSNIPAFVDQGELSRVFAPCPGLLAARLLGGGSALVSFQDPASASSCKNLYDRWAGWGAPLVCELLDAPAPSMGAGAKRPREEDQYAGPSAAGFNLYGETPLL